MISLPLAVENAKMDDLRVISDVFQDGVPDYYTNEFMVLKDGPIKTLSDLKGTVVATNLAGSAVDIAMRSMLAQRRSLRWPSDPSALTRNFGARNSERPRNDQIGRAHV